MDNFRRQSIKNISDRTVSLLDAELIHEDELALGTLTGKDAVKNYFENKEAKSKGIYRLYGRIQLKDYRLHKKVQVNYCFNNEDWLAINATYVKDTDYGFELWEFTTRAHEFFRFDDTPIKHPRFELAVSYEVDGRRYWDNHSWNDKEKWWNDHIVTYPLLSRQQACMLV